MNAAPLQNPVFTRMQDKVCSLILVSEYVKSSSICVHSAELNHAKLNQITLSQPMMCNSELSQA
jgi:hypothetical protein